MTALEIGLLGELTVTRDRHPVTVTGPGRRALLALLATHTGRVLTVEQIIDALWGEDAPPSAVKVVQTHVSQLRRLLEPDGDGGWRLLVTRPSGYCLDVEAEAVDVRRFEAAITDAASLPPTGSVAPLRDALVLWRGEPYAGIDRPFVGVEAARLHRLRRGALTRCLAGEVAQGRHREAEPELRALQAEAPLDESVAELLMLALYRSGRHGEALEVHEGLRRHLAEELGTDPGRSVMHLHERIVRHDPELGVALPGGSAHPEVLALEPASGQDRMSGQGRLRGPGRVSGQVRANGPGEASGQDQVSGSARGNLPPPRSSFIGREAEVAEVARMVRDQRLTTLVGAGGAGKTRLAIRAATEAASAFDSAWLISLGTLDDPSQLAGHCLAELGLTDQMDRHPTDTLRGWIGSRRRLLVLDNCEHLVADVAALVEPLLVSCPNLHVLATSRLPLRCAGEHQWRVPTLTVPTSPALEAVVASEAGTLFAERAADANPRFQLDDASAPSVHRICRRLDGIPLAIELAAVRMASMSAADLANGLDDRFQLLTVGSRTALPRHRTLLATTDWSYGLLTGVQQVLLCRLSTFVADFSVDMAAEVCGWPPLERRAVPGLLADLVEHSLVEADEVEGDAEGHTRYRLLETVREYGREHLGDEVEEATHRYCAWIAELAEVVGAHAQIDTPTWYARLDREFLHLQGAFAAAVRQQDAATALRIASGSGWAPIIIGRFHRLREWLHQALELAKHDADIDDRIMAQGLMMAGAVAGIDHRFEGTLELLARARERFERIDDVAGMLWTGYWRAATLGEMGELEASLPVIEQTVAEAARHGLEVVEANVRAEQTELIVAAAIDRGALDEATLAAARAALTRAQTLAGANGMQELSARVGFSDVVLTALEGDPAAALLLAQQRLDDWRVFGRGNRLILALIATARIALLADRPEGARPLMAEAAGLIAECAWAAPLHGAAEVLASLSADTDPEATALLVGAAEARPPTHRWRLPADLRTIRAMATDALGDAAFSSLREEGARYSLDEVVELAARALRMPAGQGREA